MIPSHMQIIEVFGLIWLAMAATGVWESYVEGRNAWDRGKLGWKIRIGSFILTGYHFFLFWVTFPLLLALPFVFAGWNLRLFGIIVSAYASGIIIEDFAWYLANPAVSLSEWRTEFSDYYPWIKIGRAKIVPLSYALGILIALLSWSLLWR